MPSLFERYRPKALSEVIGQPKAVACLERLAATGFGGRALWFAGPSGTGKTTLARIVASMVSADCWGTDEMDGRELTEARLDGIIRTQWQRPLSGGRAIIVNEAHTMRPAVVGRLLTDLEPIPPHLTWLFTTTDDGQAKLLDDMDDIGPLLSRCIPVPMARQGLAEPFARRLKEIAQLEGLDGKELKVYVRAVQDRHNNMRAGLSAVEAGAMLD